MSEEHEVEGEDEVIFGTAGAVVVIVGVEEVEARVALFKGTSGAQEEGAVVLDIDGRHVKIVAPLLADH
jgi:hypothetical protein